MTIHKAKRATLMGARAHGILTQGATIDPRAIYLQALGCTSQRSHGSSIIGDKMKSASSLGCNSMSLILIIDHDYKDEKLT